MGESTPSRECAVHQLTKDRDARVETLALFAQAIYLLFAAVYVCKETVEHLLLSYGQEGREGHHHHAGDDASGVIG
jgi:divalent metal cation (Fe/Co/Zn/Cd) transporter